MNIPRAARQRALDRAGFQCERCGQPSRHRDIRSTGLGLVIHHRNEDRSDNSEENLTPLCRCCHQKRHRNPGGFVAKTLVRILELSDEDIGLLGRLMDETGMGASEVIRAALRQTGSLEAWEWPKKGPPRQDRRETDPE